MNEPFSSTKGMKLLCVDDSKTNLAILKDIFKDEGYQMAFANSGEDALEVIMDFLPDLVLLDVIMPGIDGYEVCKRFKENPEIRDIPVIFVTGVGEKLQRALGYQVGCVDYIAKPFETFDVVAKVKTHLFLKSLQNENKELKRRIQELEQK